MTSVYQTKTRHSKSRPSTLGQCRWFALICLLTIPLAGCSHGAGFGSMSSLMPGNSVSGQWEPDVDYEAEAAAREQNKQSDH